MENIVISEIISITTCYSHIVTNKEITFFMFIYFLI